MFVLFFKDCDSSSGITNLRYPYGPLHIHLEMNTFCFKQIDGLLAKFLALWWKVVNQIIIRYERIRYDKCELQNFCGNWNRGFASRLCLVWILKSAGLRVASVPNYISRLFSRPSGITPGQHHEETEVRRWFIFPRPKIFLPSWRSPLLCRLERNITWSMASNQRCWIRNEEPMSEYYFTN